MHKAGALILASGLLLIVAGFINGLVVTQGQSHLPRLVAHDAYAPALATLAAGGDTADVREQRAQASARSLAYQRVVGFHTHAINMAALLVLTALLYCLLPPAGRGAGLALTAFAAACWLYPLGLLLHVFELTAAARVTAAGGAGLAVLSLAFLFYRVATSLPAPADSEG